MKPLAATRQKINLTLLDKYAKIIAQVTTVTILIFCVACQDKKSQPKDSNSLSVNILDTVAIISFPNVLALDTNYTWVDNSDTDCSSFRKIRYQNKKDSSHQETGFIHLTRPPKFKTYLTFKTEEYINCINRIEPRNFKSESAKFGRNIIANEKMNGWNVERVIDFSFINSNNIQVYITGYFLKIRQNELKVSFSVLTFNPRNNIPIQIDFDKTMQSYDKQFATSCIVTVSNIDID